MLAVIALPGVARANSILNGGFESGFTDWTVDPALSGSLILDGSHSGSDAAWFGAIGSSDDSLLQTFATLPGESYVVTFWLAHGATDRSNDFSAWWNSNPLLTLTNAHGFGETSYSFTMTAQDDQTTLRFSGRELRDYYYLDNVSVVPLSTPEPTTLALLLVGVATVVGRARLARSRRRQ